MMLLVGFALGGCAMPDTDSFRGPDAATMFRPMSVVGVRERTLVPVTPADLVDAEGRCAAAPANAPPADGGASPTQDAIPATAPGIAIDMTECDVVNRAGQPERVEIGSNERSERTAVLTFIRGARPGIYHFTAGRLTSMERAPEPAPAAKPAKKKPAPKRAQTAGR
jgi:hypothetical protein